MKHYVYIFAKQGVPFYVGKGSKARFLEHLDRADFPSLNQVTVNFIECSSAKTALFEEQRLIQALGLDSQGGVLINKLIPRGYSLPSRGYDSRAGDRPMHMGALYRYAAHIAKKVGMTEDALKALIARNKNVRRIKTGRGTKYLVDDVLDLIEKSHLFRD